MKLNEWLCEGSKNISRALAEANHESLYRYETLNHTTRTQIIDILNRLRCLILPGIYERTPVHREMLQSVIENNIQHTAIDLCRIISSVFAHEKGEDDPSVHQEQSQQVVISILEALPGIRKLVDGDIQAAYEGDPAAKSFEEIVLSYPSIEAVSIYRIAHMIHSLEVPIIPRIMTEYAHQNTGIDIHPGARIGEHFFIDHGTGVVIGETCTIGSHVKLYQGVTLGAKSFPLDEHGNPIKGIKRHPDIEDNVVIYAGATILGGDTRIGHDSVIGGNVWLTHSVPPYSTVFNAQPSPIIKPNDGDDLH